MGVLINNTASAVEAAQIDDKHFIFQLPNCTVEGAEQKKRSHYPLCRWSSGSRLGEDSEHEEKMLSDRAVEQVNSMSLKERDYICMTLGDTEVSHETPADWYNQELGGHLIVGGPAVAPTKSTNISNGTPSSSSTGRNNNKEEIEEKNKVW